MGAGKPAARHLPVNGQCTAAAAVSAEPRLQPRTTTVLITINDQRRVDVAGKPAARHVPVNGQSTAASAVNAEPRLQPRIVATRSPISTVAPSQRFPTVDLGPP